MPPLRWSAPRALSRGWRREARLLMLQAIFTSYFGDIGVLVAVPYLVPAEVAVFGLCLKIALLVGYFVQVAQEMALPDLADSRHAHDVVGMHRSVRRAILLPAALTISAMTVIALFGDRILLIFGPQFASGQWALVILIATQMVRALAGPSTYLMTLSGKQTLNAAITASVIAVLLIASVVLIPPFGIEGAALAVFLSYASWIMAAIITLRRLGEPRIDAMALLAARGSAMKRG